MTRAPLDLTCTCGQIEGHLRNFSPRMGTHAECFCKDCRAAELYLHQPDPAPGAVGVFQSTPDHLILTKGSEHLAVFSFGEKNLLRWYASCCGTPLFNTPRDPRMSFVAIRTAAIADTAALGPVTAQAFIPAGNDKTRHKGIIRLVGAAVARIALRRITGRWRDNPLFDTDSATPVRPVTVLAQGTRSRLLNERSRP
ncbi:hypothetical protein BOO69_05475 [Sulfitobacter alexandrii]|uniref:CENP-V/GFA domain-containing protein n=1 Tax=Sulfitobacter alexandrii TaxID=1917485 RepID=A0A1J0WFM7_9RHOB|nr:DUF6151 family protein [Sulfitobacter alexandrii]APE42934.1 hypothetical protein BOO69_05475 [Sulfitobacter alexandrii]